MREISTFNTITDIEISAIKHERNNNNTKFVRKKLNWSIMIKYAIQWNRRTVIYISYKKIIPVAKMLPNKCTKFWLLRKLCRWTSNIEKEKIQFLISRRKRKPLYNMNNERCSLLKIWKSHNSHLYSDIDPHLPARSISPIFPWIDRNKTLETQ